MASIFPGHPLGRCNIYRPQRRQTLEVIHFFAGLLGQSGFKDKAARLRGSEAQRLPSLIAAGPIGPCGRRMRMKTPALADSLNP